MSLTDLFSQLGSYFETSPSTTYNLALTAAIIIALWLVRLLVIRVVNRKVEDTRVQYKWRKNLTYTFVTLGIFLVGRLWFEGLQSLATFLGLLSAGLAIALRDPVSDMAGWLFLIWRKPFDIGDRIEIGNVKGDVIDQRIFKFTILEIGNWVHADQSTGRVIHVPNHKIFNESLANYTSEFEFIWNEIPVLITFESNWKKAKEILQGIVDEQLQDFSSKAATQVQRAAKSYMIYYSYLTPIVYTDVRDSGVRLTIRHLTNPRQRRSTQQQIWEEILEAFHAEDDIDFAYPTMRYYNNRLEGKPGARADGATSE